MVWPFNKNKRAQTSPPPVPKSMGEFFATAVAEIDQQIAHDIDWYSKLPYQGGLSKEAARNFEIEKRALWKRVIYDAKRSDINGLIWTTRQDSLVCGFCNSMHNKHFLKNQLDELNAIDIHLGCRCELVPVR